MTKELLEQYPDICAEIERLGRPVKDTVSGSLPDFPYTKRTWTIQGICPDSSYLDDLKAKKQEILEFVQRLDLTEKSIVIYRAIYGFSWPIVAARMGHRYTEQAVKKRYYRILKKYF